MKHCSRIDSFTLTDKLKYLGDDIEIISKLQKRYFNNTQEPTLLKIYKIKKREKTIIV